ncbi:MAG: PAS domain S-box protein [Candidatus Hydrogenedentes bacterium]|nr:PAS domain S-box protein [Candidatus Hydrogenedentota bacterium]
MNDRLDRGSPGKQYRWLALTLIISGVVVFLLSFYPNMFLKNELVGDAFELVGTAGLVFGVSVFVGQLSRSTYATGLYLGGCFLLTLARFLDFTEEINGLSGVFLVGDNGLGHDLAMRMSESVGYIGLLLSMLALMHELSRMMLNAEEEGRRYKSLHQASQYLTRVADMTADAVFAVDDAGSVQTWNKGAERLFQFSKEQALGKDLRHLLVTGLGDVQDGVAAWATNSASRQEIDVTARSASGVEFAAGASFSPIYGDDGAILGVSVVVRNIEVRKRAERELVASHRMLSGALHAADVGMFVLNRQGSAIEFNARMQELTGITLATIEADTLQTIAKDLLEDPESFISAIYDRVLKLGKHVELRNIRLRRPDGSLRICNGAIAPVMDENGSVIAAAGVVVDITEREALQSRLLEAQKMDSVGRLAGGIAHDFNNILTGVLGYATLAKQATQPESPVMKHLAQIEASAVRASELTHQLLTFARGGSRNETKLALHPIIDETVKLVAHSINPNVKISFTSGDTLDQVSADPAQIHQLLMNLFLNARDAIDFAGEIRVMAQNIEVTDADREKLQIASPGRYVRIRVEDTGRGIAPEVVARIFEPFFSTKKQGQAYGLGLSVVYGIVHSHRGAITVNSALGEGSTFDVYLPSAGQVVVQPKPENGTIVKRERDTILVVDDEQLLRAVLQDILEMSGYDVIQASTGEEAIEVYQSRGKDISLVIMDVVMPGMGGARALDELWKINPDLRCVVSSGFGGEAINENHHSQFLRFVPKPFSTTNVTSAIHDLLHA